MSVESKMPAACPLPGLKAVHLETSRHIVPVSGPLTLWKRRENGRSGPLESIDESLFGAVIL
jgi:hypothetical protein